MEPVKRVEVIINGRAMRRVCEALDRLQVGGYTVLQGATGRGNRGVQAGDDLDGLLANSVLITAVEAATVDPLVAAIRPLLVQFGGVCLVSDAAWVRH